MPKLPLYNAGKAATAAGKAMQKSHSGAATTNEDGTKIVGPEDPRIGWGGKGTMPRKIADTVKEAWDNSAGRMPEVGYIRKKKDGADRGDFIKPSVSHYQSGKDWEPEDKD